MKIAHLSDIHIRFASRHDEYRDVFKNLFQDLQTQKPDRIAITGDLNHIKVNMSPGSIDLLSELLIGLIRIAPVDLIPGNHDYNLQQKEQGDTISPIFKIADRFSDLMTDSNVVIERKSFIVNENNAKSIDFSKKSIYFFSDSGFYKISDKLIYGVYSCKDNKILTLGKKTSGVKYVALYHGQVKGAKGDNGYELTGDNLLSTSTFNNFDVVMLGDIHEHQTFREDESMAYAGSLIQQDYGESADKGYLIWDLDKNSFQRRYVLNDYGFAKITIAKGEIFEERVENIIFSNDKRKTKVYVVWEDYEENYSTEKEAQIAKLIKQKFGCEVVKIEFSELAKSEQENNDVSDSLNQETFLQQVENYIKETNPDEDDTTIKDVVELAREIDAELEIPDKIPPVKLWDIDGVEISNVFSFPEKPTFIPLENLTGITGIFGKNYSGKSNVVKSIVWGLYQHIIGGGVSKKIVNLYTESNKGYVKTYLTINGEKYYIKRDVVTTVKKSGETNNTYPIEFKKLTIDQNGKEQWVSELSENKATEKKEIKAIVLDAIGTVDDFTKVCLQTQSGKEGYINQDQQPKNDLVNKYLGLEPYRDRYEYGNKKLNEIKKHQKELGSIVSLQEKVVETENKIAALNSEYDRIIKEKADSEEKKEKIDEEIITLSKTLKQYHPIISEEQSDEHAILLKIDSLKSEVKDQEQKVLDLTYWLSVNFKKELPFDEKDSAETLSAELNKESIAFSEEKARYIETENWLKNNPTRKLKKTEGFEQTIQNLRADITSLQAKLPTFKGEKCPTCGHITAEPNPEMYNQCINDISVKTGEINAYTNIINENVANLAHNNNVALLESNLQTLKANLITRKNIKESLLQKISLIAQSQDIVNHNNLVEQNSSNVQLIRNSISFNHSVLEKLDLNLSKVKFNSECKKHNESIELKIESLQEQSKAHKFSIYGLSQEITNKNGDIRVEKNNLENYSSRLEEVKSAERVFKKYSLYLQAVHRDGIPAKIIRRKLPIINNKINSILSTMVNFKVEMTVTTKGDIVEGFYFSPDKSDMLPLSYASGAQSFICGVVIKDALHYMSNLIKPSLNIIDEGFGTLDDELISAIITVLQYLKNKYKNVLVITHRNEIKDSVNNIIEVYKSKEGISQDILDINPDAGITKLNIS